MDFIVDYNLALYSSNITEPNLVSVITAKNLPVSKKLKTSDEFLEQLALLGKSKDIDEIVNIISDISSEWKAVSIHSWLSIYITTSVLNLLETRYGIIEEAFPLITYKEECMEMLEIKGIKKYVVDFIIYLVNNVFVEIDIDQIKETEESDIGVVSLLIIKNVLILPKITRYRYAEKAIRSSAYTNETLHLIFKQAFDMLPDEVNMLEVVDISLNKYRVFKGAALKNSVPRFFKAELLNSF